MNGFEQEARITGQLQHPNIPAVHELGVLPDGRPFLAMKFISGETLEELLRDRNSFEQDPVRYLSAFSQVAHAIAFAHSRGILHRDLKPQNVMIGAFGEVQVMDWGLAKIVDCLSHVTDHSDNDSSECDASVKSGRSTKVDLLTKVGSVLGTPAYMPPEQATGAINQIDYRSDVFGPGGILATMLTGMPVYVAESRESIRSMAAKGEVNACLNG